MAIWFVQAFLFVSLLTIARFEDFHEYSTKYLPSDITEEQRLKYYTVWKDNVDFIRDHNSQTDSFKLGTNPLTHLLPHQLPKRTKPSSILRPPLVANDKAPSLATQAPPPSEVDWRVKGDVTAVHEQGKSGCVFEFAFADAISSFYAISTGQRLVQFSPQQLIDCCTRDCRCNELHEPGQLAYCIKKHGGLCPDYPSSNNTECECLKCNQPKFMIKGMNEVPSGNETALMYAVAKQPVMVAVDAGHQSFQLYKEGIYSDADCSTHKLDHDLLVVGYGNDDGKDFWLCKNSWGPEWGMNGYIKIARNDGNMCGIATAAYYPR